MNNTTQNNVRFIGYGLLVVALLILLTVVFTNQVSLAGLNRRSHSPLSRIQKNIPVVEDYYAKNWDFRARNATDHVFVLSPPGEPLEKFLFRMACSIALSAHMGFPPPIAVLSSGRVSDSATSARDIPELINEIFPRLRVLSVPDPKAFIASTYPEAMIIRGSISRETRDMFVEFPEIKSPIVVLEGDWESWKYTEDYRSSIFEHLEFHPSLYHYVRKTYPVLCDRRSPVRGVILNGVGETTVGEIQRFISRNKLTNEKIIIFDRGGSLGESDVASLGGATLVVSGECSHAIIYLSVFCRELLIDSSLTGWWAGMHAFYRGRTVYCMTSDESEHFMSPHWLSNKSD